MFMALYNYGVQDFTCQQIPTAIIPRQYIAEDTLLAFYIAMLELPAYRYIC
jgi:hypothetical protein